MMDFTQYLDEFLYEAETHVFLPNQLIISKVYIKVGGA